MTRRRALFWSLSGLLAAGTVLAGAPASQADVVLKPGGIIVGTGSGATGRPTVVTKTDSTLSVGGILVDGTYAVETTFVDPDKPNDSGVTRTGTITVEVTRTETYSDGKVYGKGDATVELDGLTVQGSVLARANRGKLEVFEVNALYRPGKPNTLNRPGFYFSTSNCPVSCRTVEDSTLVRFKGGSSQSVEREDGKGQKSLLGRFTAFRTS